MEAKVREIEVLHRKRDAQQGMVEAFRILQDVVDVDHSCILESTCAAYDAWENVLQKREVYMQQKSRFNRHFEAMQGDRS